MGWSKVVAAGIGWALLIDVVAWLVLVILVLLFG